MSVLLTSSAMMNLFLVFAQILTAIAKLLTPGGTRALASREYLNQILFWNERDLEEKVEEFQVYYNAHRVHQSLNLKTPDEAAGKGPPTRAKLGKFAWRSHCSGLFHSPMAARLRIRHAQGICREFF